MKLIVILIISVFASNEKENATEKSESNILVSLTQSSNLVKIEEDEYVKKNNSHYFGVDYNNKYETWRARRWSKNKKKDVYNGNNYKDRETAAHASDTLARKLIANSEKYHNLNFPDNNIEFWAEEKSSNYIGVSYNTKQERWRAGRRSKHDNKNVHNGTFYRDEKAAAQASDTLARKLIANGEKGHKLNFPDDDIEVYPKKKINYIGVSYNESKLKWRAYRWSKHENKAVFNGTYKDAETASHASDTLARKLIANGEKGHKLNFPAGDNVEHPKKNQNNKRKRPADFKNSQKDGRLLDKFE